MAVKKKSKGKAGKKKAVARPKAKLKKKVCEFC